MSRADLPVDVAKVKRWLRSYNDRDRDIDTQLERLDKLETRLKSFGVPVLSDMPKSPSAADDRTADLVSQKVDLEKEIRTALVDQKTFRNQIYSLIDMVNNPDERAVLRIKYIDGYQWQDICDMLFGSRIDYVDKEESYLRRTHKIHKAALERVVRIINSKEVDIFGS